MPRKEKKYHYIYKTVNILSGKYYLGMHSTDKLDDGYLGSGTRLRYSINKHGKNYHKLEILEFCASREELKKRESEIVNLNEIAKVDCMNLCVGGQGGFISLDGSKRGAKTTNSKYRDKLVEWAAKGGKTTFLKHGLQKNFLPVDWTGKKHSEETKDKMRKPKNGGKSNSQFGSCWITNEILNKKIKRGDLIPEGWRLGRKII